MASWWEHLGTRGPIQYHRRGVAVGPAAAWLEALQAPHKHLETFERSAHFTMLEEPGRFLLALVQQVLPHTEGAPAFEPRPRGA